MLWRSLYLHIWSRMCRYKKKSTFFIQGWLILPRTPSIVRILQIKYIWFSTSYHQASVMLIYEPNPTSAEYTEKPHFFPPYLPHCQAVKTSQLFIFISQVSFLFFIPHPTGSLFRLCIVPCAVARSLPRAQSRYAMSRFVFKASPCWLPLWAPL